MEYKITVENFEYAIRHGEAYLTRIVDEEIVPNSLIIPSFVTIKNGHKIPVVGIEEGVFSSSYGTYNLKSIIIPDCVREIKAFNFQEMYDLQSIIIGEGVLSLENCLTFCDQLSSIVCNKKIRFSNSTNWLFDTKWYQNQPTGNIIIGATLISYKLSANEILKEYKVPDEVLYIYKGAFDGCKDLEYIDFNNAIIVESTLPNGVSSITASGNALQEVVSFENTIWLQNQPDGCIYLGNLLVKYKNNNNHIPALIQLRTGTNSINREAFIDTNKDNNPPFTVVCNDELHTIGEKAFKCSAISRILLPNNFLSIKAEAFYFSNLAVCNLPSGLKEIGIAAFCCTHLTSISIPYSVSEIPERAFYKNEYLSDVHIEEGVLQIGQKAFADCSIQSLVIPTTVKKIANKAFYNNVLENLIFTEGIEEFGEEAFASNKSYNSFKVLEIPSTLKKIGTKTFYRHWYSEPEYHDGEYFPDTDENRSNLEILIINNDIEHSLSGINQELHTIIIKEGVTIIPEYAFAGSKKLRNIILPSTLQTIKQYAFGWCSALETIILPNNITELWSNALPPRIKKIILANNQITLNIMNFNKKRYDYLIRNKVFVDLQGNIVTPNLNIYALGECNGDDNGYIIEGNYYKITKVEDFDENAINPHEAIYEVEIERDNKDSDSCYSQYSGYNDWDDDTINSAFEGNPIATWNVD